MKLGSKTSSGFGVLVLWASGALSATASVVAPPDLDACKTGEPTALMVEKVASQFGVPSGCFVSKETYQQQGTYKSIPQPVEYAFAITIRPPQASPFTTENVDQMFSATSAQWKNVDALWQQDEPNYKKRLNQLIQSTSSGNVKDQNISVKQPLLISMERLDPNSYVVVSVRKRVISVVGNSFTSTKADGAAILLHGGNLIRLSIARELRSSSDVDYVKKTITSWARDVEEGKP